MDATRSAEPVAIVGIGCRFPGGASSPDEFWSLLARGGDAIGELPSGRFDLDAFFDPNPEVPGKLYSRWGGFVERLDELDADFFGIAPREARHLDPQHRLILEVVWEALQDGGQVIARLAGSRTGVFVGISSHDHADGSASPAYRPLLDTHNVTSAAAFSAANRVSRLLDVRGPSFAVDTACSSSLTALHLARQSLRNRDCDLAIVAGVNAILTPEAFIALSKARVLSPDGRCRAFDARANGYVRGEGAGAIVLKPLDRALGDGDPIHAVLRATAANQDGRTPALGIPSAESQEAMFRDALRDAGLGAHAVQYVEAHGTGTATGDPIEATAIGRVYGVGRPVSKPCLIGSVKTNIGHLEAGAGIAGLIKAALALEHRQIPPSLHLSEPNPAIPFHELRLRVPTTIEPWPETDGPAMAAVSSFGIGGANAHAILEQPPIAVAPLSTARSAHILAISARSASALNEYADALGRRLDVDAGSLSDICHTAATRRDHYEHRVAVVGESRQQMAESLRAFARGEERRDVMSGRCRRDAPSRIAFVFSGMGPQSAGMGLALANDEPAIRDALAECDAILRPIAGWSLLGELARPKNESRVATAEIAHVANLCLQVALVGLWRSWGVVPSIVLGHSSAEMAAAWASGALDLADAIRLAYHRGRLQHRLTGSGRMLAAGITLEEATILVDGHRDAVAIAAVNGPASVTLSGSADPLQQLATELDRKGRFCRFLPVEVPYHAPSMELIRDELYACYAGLRPRETTIPMISSATGRRVDGRALDASHWWRTVRDQVRFADGMDALIAHGSEIFLEVGPHPVLGASIGACLESRGRPGLILSSLRGHTNESEAMLRSLGTLFTRGWQVRWPAVYPKGSPVSLPKHPWRRERHWLDVPEVSDEWRRRSSAAGSGHPLLGTRLRSPRATWESELSNPELRYLDGHRVGDAIVFPAAAYVEMALSALQTLTPGERPTIRDVQFHRMLAIPRLDETVVQLLHDPAVSSIEIHGATGSGDRAWTLHASCVVARAPSSPGTTTSRDARIDVAALRARCSEQVSPRELYESLSARRLHYGGLFRGVRALWRGRGEALGQVGVEPNEQQRYGIHPALLDSAFQVLAGALATNGIRSMGTVVPISIRSLTLARRPTAQCWVHVRVGATDSGDIEGDVDLFDDDGQLVLSCSGLRLRAIDTHAAVSEGADELLSELVWDDVTYPERREPSAFDPRQLAESLSPRLNALTEPIIASGYYERGEARLDHIARLFAAGALRELGFEPQRDRASSLAETAARLGVAPQYGRLFERMIEMSAQADDASPGADSLQSLAGAALAELPGCAAEIRLLAHCGARLADVVRGAVDARELLFGEQRRLVIAQYHDSPVTRIYNELAAEALAGLPMPQPGAPPLRVLEIGAGTGALTAAAIRCLAARPVEYCFSDASPFFFPAARERFADARLTCRVLDIEADPVGQGFAAGAFDVVLASDVLHATRDLRQTLGNVRRLLRPGGLLALVELTRRPLWSDLVFGLLDGWWRFSDLDVRPSHALLDAPRWLSLLAEAGLEDVTVLADPPRTGGTVQSVFLARGAGAVERSTAAKDWLLLADCSGVAEAVASALEANGDSCTLVGPPDAADFSLLRARVGAAHAIVYCRSIDAPGHDATTDELMAFEARGCGGLLDLVRALEAERLTPDVWIVTTGAQPVDRFDAVDVFEAPLIGLGRVLMNEQPALRTRLVDLSPSPGGNEIDALVRELMAGDVENELALRGSRRFARRIRGIEAEGQTADDVRIDVSPDTATFVLDQRVTSALDSLDLCEVPHREPGAHEILIRVVAAGLNFRNVLKALAMPPFAGTRAAADASPQEECAGIVVACGEGVDRFHVGDEVIALASTAIGSHVVASASLTVRKPAALSFEDAATVLVGFVTAHYALHHLARMARGERVLIHSATGAVGLAAIQLCQRAGVEVWATAGSDEKRDYLRSLGIAHVFDSRSLGFADEVLARTHGEGVDVILNSLAGDAITRGLEILRPRGRFVEIGKRDIYGDSRLGLLPFRNNLSFFGLDMGAPGLIDVELLDLIAHQLADGSLRPLPRTVFDIANAEQGFRLMAQARHIGKVVLAVSAPSYRVVRQHPRADFSADATYLITGGLGGFGIAVAHWMVDRGARHVVLMSRTGTPRPEDDAALAALDSRAHVVRCAADVAREADVARVLATIRDRMPPLRGIVHAAMVLDDGMLAQLDTERLERVLAPKVAGAWNLHQQTLGHSLDFFVLFSSIASVLGHSLQGNYAAANSFLDALSAYRRARGLPAATISWGALSDIGYVARHEAIRAHIARLGLELMTPREAFHALDRVLEGGHVHVVATRSDWELLANWSHMVAASRPRLDRRRIPRTQPQAPDGGRAMLIDTVRAAAAPERLELLQTHVLEKVARILGTTADRLDPERGLTDLGLDSLMAVELTTSIKLELSTQLGVAELLQGLSSRDVAAAILARLDVQFAAVAPVAGGSFGTPEANEVLPLSAEQRQFWVLDRLMPGSPAYNLTANARLTGALDLAALGRAFDGVVRRHDVLRARFDMAGDEPMQIIQSRDGLALPIIELGALAGGDRQREVHRLAREEARRPFDLRRDPPIRATVLRLTPNEHVVLLTVHHIAADAWALNVLVREVATLYEASLGGRPAPLPTPAPRYAGYVRAQQHRLRDDGARNQLDYWKARLAGAPASLGLLTDRPRPSQVTSHGGHVPFELSAELSARLVDWSRKEGVTLFTTLLAAFQTLLHRYTGEDDISVGSPVSMRAEPAGQSLVGCCMNTVVLRTDLGGDPSFRQLVRRARDVTLGALANADVPFDRVVSAVAPRREPGRMPLFDVMLVLHNLRLPPLSLTGATLEPLESESGIASSDLMLVIDTGERLRGTLEYRVDLFDDATASRVVTQFASLLESIVANPEARLSELSIESEAERRALNGWNDTVLEFPGPWTLGALIAEQIARTPGAPAVVSGGRCLTYEELGEARARFARSLRSRGVSGGDSVVVCADRSVDLVAAMLAVVSIGAIYVPLDREQPLHRLAMMLEDVRPRVVVTQASLSQRFASAGASLLLLDDDGEVAPSPESEPTTPVPDDVAYIVFTSGSTGRPKGVVVEHRAICNQIQWRNAAFAISPSDAVLQRMPLAFDPSVWELFGPLAAGARVILPAPDVDRDPTAMIRVIRQEGVTTIQVVPALLDALLDAPGVEDCRSLVRVFCGGDVLTPALRDRFTARLPWAELCNLYGPTEATIDSTGFRCAADASGRRVPIGRPIANARVYVLDETGREAPVGVPGELHIGGVGLARGYLNDAVETARRFVPDPFGGGRLFRTGDRARRRADGALEFLGRLDGQIKVRGVRVEPGEIEAALLAHPGVREVAVVGPDLVAYVVGQGAAPLPLGAEWRRFLVDRLPDVMVPREVVVLDRLPRGSNGKLARDQLPAAPRRGGPTGSVVAPRNDLERQVAQVWRELLEVGTIGVGDDFFTLGGHSLLATRLVARLETVFGTSIDVASFFRQPTVEGLSRIIAGADRASASLAIALRPSGAKPPLFLVHGLSGSALSYLDLARWLDADRPVFAIRAQGTEEGEQTLTTIEQLAGRYVEAVRAIRAEGPYLLAGWSMGGVIALEMARQLRTTGSTVELVSVLDSSPSPLALSSWPADMRDTMLRRLVEGLGVEELPARGDLFWSLSIDEQLAVLEERVLATSASTPNGARGRVVRQLRVVRANVAAVHAHRSHPSEGPVALIRAEASTSTFADESFGWRDVVGEELSIHTVPGDHHSLLREPGCIAVARLLDALLDGRDDASVHGAQLV